MLADDESDLVYHIVCSRDRPDGEPAEGLRPLEVSWFTSDEHHPRVSEMPASHRHVFERANEFAGGAARKPQPSTRAIPAVDRRAAATCRRGSATSTRSSARPTGSRSITRSAWSVLRATHVCVLLMGIAYVSYTDFSRPRAAARRPAAHAPWRSANVANRGAWHRKYLDYRTLAEGLRVQFYWAAGGVTTGTVSKFAHDTFLQMQDPDLGWIRNVMRVAGTECDVAPQPRPGGPRVSRSRVDRRRANGPTGVLRAQGGRAPART